MIGPVDVRFLDDGRNVMVLSPFTYKQWTVPAGFISDGASIPRELWSTVGSPFTGKYRRAAILHDYLYSIQTISREMADQLLKEAMAEDGTEIVLAGIIYEGVRVGGGFSWSDDGNKRKTTHV